MQLDAIELTRWTQLSIACPHCGNRGQPRGQWAKNAPVPFKLVEQVVRSFMFAAMIDERGSLSIVADVETDQVDWESGDGVRFECMQCFGQFPVPENASVDFD
jgi:hypothetical protein